jgi:hypothetical protein
MEDSKTMSKDSTFVDGNIKEIEAVLRQYIKSKTLTEDAYKYMSLIVNEDCPKN